MRLAPSNSSWVKNTTGEWLRREKESSVTPRGDPSGTEPLGPVRPVERGPKLLGGDRFEKGLIVILGGIVLSALGVLVIRAVAVGVLDSMLASSHALEAVASDKHPALVVMLMFLLVLPALYVGGLKGPVVRLLAGLGITLPLYHFDWSFFFKVWSNLIVMMGLSLTLASCLSSWRKYVAAELAGLLMAVLVTAWDPGAEMKVTLVLGLVFAGPLVALGVAILHVAERLARKSTEPDVSLGQNL